MVQPVIIQPNYMNAMTQGLGTNLAYMAESKKGGGNIMRGGGRSGPSKQEQAGIDKKAEAENRRKEDIKRNALYKEKQAVEDKIRSHEETVAVKEETTRKKNFMEQFKGYASAVTQDNYDDYLAFAKENGVDLPGVATPEQARQMQPDQFKSYMGGFFGGKKTSEKSLGRIEEEAAARARGGNKGYTKQQLVDDTRGHYSFLTKSLLDEDGFIKEGMEEQYKTLTDKFETDIKTVGGGGQPSWLVGETQAEPGAADVTSTFPPPAENKGRTIKTEDGKRFFSTGERWEEI